MEGGIKYSLKGTRASLKAKDGHAFMDFWVSWDVLEILDSEKYTATKNISSLLLKQIVSQFPRADIIRWELADTNLQKYNEAKNKNKKWDDLFVSIPICRACLENGFTEITLQAKEGKIFFKARKATPSS